MKKITAALIGAILVAIAIANATPVNTKVDTLTVQNQGRLKPCTAGSVLSAGPLNNWNPTCLATNSLIQVTAADNTGTTITGIDAVDNSLPIGSTVTICNESAPADDGMLSFTSLDGNSAVGNRVLTPGTGRQRNCSVTTADFCQQNSDCPGGETCLASTGPRFYIGSDHCATFRYVNAGASTTNVFPEWMVESQTRFSSAIVQNLQFYPAMTAAAITSGTTVDDYNPTCSGGLPCSEAGGDNAFLNYTMVFLQTSSTGGATISGLHYASTTQSATQGPYKVITNLGPGPITLKNNGSSFTLDNINVAVASDSRHDIVLNPSSSVMLYHQRDTGGWIPQGKRDYYFDERDVNMANGLEVDGPNPNASVANTTLFVKKSADAGGFNAYINDTHSYSVNSSHTGLAIVQNGAGLSASNNHALEVDAPGGEAFQIDDGGMYLGNGSPMPYAYINSSVPVDMSNGLNVQKSLVVGSSAFGGTTTTTFNATTGHQIAVAGGTPALSSCGSSPAAQITGTDRAGYFTTGGTATACTLTFATTYTNRPMCHVTAEGTATQPTYTVSATAITITVDIAVTTYNYDCIGAPTST